MTFISNMVTPFAPKHTSLKAVIYLNKIPYTWFKGLHQHVFIVVWTKPCHILSKFSNKGSYSSNFEPHMHAHLHIQEWVLTKVTSSQDVNKFLLIAHQSWWLWTLLSAWYCPYPNHHFYKTCFNSTMHFT